MELTERARRVFAADRFAALAGIEIDAVGDGESRCSMPLDERHRNARGAAMGGALFTLADLAAAVAGNSADLAAGDELHWVSLDSTVHYLSPALGPRIDAHCQALKRGRTTALYQTVLLCNGKKVAIVETTMMRTQG